jgi:hypothetical protein
LSCTKVYGKVTLGTGVYTAFLPTSLARVRGDLIAPGTPGFVTGVTTIGGSSTQNGFTVVSSLALRELMSVGDLNWITVPVVRLSSCTKVDGKVTPGTGVYTAFLPTSLAKMRGDIIAPGPPGLVTGFTTIGGFLTRKLFSKLVTKAENVLITDNLLRSLNGINLGTAARFNINNNRYLKTVDVPLSTVSNMLVPETKGKGLNGSFPQLQWSNNITIRHALTMYFPVLEKMNRSEAFVNNTFTSVESFAITSSSKLNNNLANSLESVGGTFQLENNTKHAIVDGFENPAVVGGALNLSGVFTEVKLRALEAVCGGVSLQFTETISCDLCDSRTLPGGIKGDGYMCEGNKDTAESKTSGPGTNGNNTGNAAATFGVNMGLVGMAGAVVLLVL